MKNIFPIFEEIDQGYCVYLLHDYKGLDDNGNPKYSEKLDMEVKIATNPNNPCEDCLFNYSKFHNCEEANNFKFTLNNNDDVVCSMHHSKIKI